MNFKTLDGIGMSGFNVFKIHAQEGGDGKLIENLPTI